MSHPDGAFEKIGRSDKPLYGPQKLLLCGFSRDARKKFASVLQTAGLGAVEASWLGPSHTDRRLVELMEMPAGIGEDAASGLPQAVIAGGITETQLRSMMTVAKKTGFTGVLWAVLTPTSENWTLDRLLAELSAERRAMKEKKR